MFKAIKYAGIMQGLAGRGIVKCQQSALKYQQIIKASAKFIFKWIPVAESEDCEGKTCACRISPAKLLEIVSLIIKRPSRLPVFLYN